MTTDRPPIRRPRLWLAAGGVLAVLGIAILWPLQQVGQVCTLIYPAPPGCGAPEPRWVPLVGIGLVIAAFAAIVIVYFTVPRPRTPIIILAGGIVVVIALAAAIVGLSQSGIWDPYQPPVMVN
jgi:peptidoglycan/LPS O-acetylase OafA/YrhL